MVTRRVTYIRVYQKFGANDLNFWAVTFSTKIINFRANAVSVKMVYFRGTVFRILICKIQIKNSVGFKSKVKRKSDDI